MDLSFVMKLVAKELGLPSSLVDELKSSKIEIVESENITTNASVALTHTQEDWGGVVIRLLITAESTGTFPVTIAVPNLVMDRLPASIKARICEVAIG